MAKYKQDLERKEWSIVTLIINLRETYTAHEMRIELEDLWPPKPAQEFLRMLAKFLYFLKTFTVIKA